MSDRLGQVHVDGGAAESHAEVFRRAALRVAGVGLLVNAMSLVAAALAGHEASTGAMWGAGAGALIALITSGALVVPWDRYPLLASSGVVLSFAGKIAVMIATVLLARPHKDSMSPGWFLGTLAAGLLSVAAVEILTLARGRTPTVQREARDRVG